MERALAAVVLVLSLGAAPAHADDPAPPAPAPMPAADQPAEPPQPPRTHVDTTVVGDAAPDNTSPSAASAGLDNDHNFEAGAPEIVSVLKKLHLSAKQQSQTNAAIEKADAGAAALIRREHANRDMVAATTPEDPMYAKLISEQSSADSRWTENREGLRRDIMDVLTPAQRARYEELEPKP